MTQSIFFNWVIDIFKEIVQLVMPGAVAIFLIIFGIRLSWNILKGRGLK